MSEKVSGRSSASRMWSMTWPDGPERRHRHEVRLHQTAGGILRIFEVALQRGAIAAAASAPGFPAGHRLGDVLEQVGGIVGLELGDGLGQHLVGQRRRELVAHGLVELGQHLRAEVAPQRLDQLRATGRLQQLDEVGEVARLQARDQRARMRPQARRQRLGDGSRQLGCGRSGLGAQLARGLSLHEDRSASVRLRLARPQAHARAPHSTVAGNVPCLPAVTQA